MVKEPVRPQAQYAGINHLCSNNARNGGFVPGCMSCRAQRHAELSRELILEDTGALEATVAESRLQREDPEIRSDTQEDNCKGF